jgi:hypothetical protein
MSSPVTTGPNAGNGGSGGARTCHKSNKINGFVGVPSLIASQNSDLPPELRRVVKSWPALSKPLKDAILAIVKAAIGDECE